MGTSVYAAGLADSYEWPASSFYLVCVSLSEAGRAQWVRLASVGAERAQLGQCRWEKGLIRCGVGHL